MFQGIPWTFSLQLISDHSPATTAMWLNATSLARRIVLPFRAYRLIELMKPPLARQCHSGVSSSLTKRDGTKIDRLHFCRVNQFTQVFLLSLGGLSSHIASSIFNAYSNLHQEKAVVCYYRNRSPGFWCFLCASKAFDRVCHHNFWSDFIELPRPTHLYYQPVDPIQNAQIVRTVGWIISGGSDQTRTRKYLTKVLIALA